MVGTILSFVRGDIGRTLEEGGVKLIQCLACTDLSVHAEPAPNISFKDNVFLLELHCPLQQPLVPCGY